MYEFLKNLRESGRLTRKTLIISFIVLLFIPFVSPLALVILGVGGWMMIRSGETDPSRYEEEISVLTHNYSFLRAYAQACGSNIIFIGGPMCHIDNVDVESGKLSLYIVDPKCIAPNAPLVLKQCDVGEKTHLQYIWTGKGRYSKTEKKTIAMAVLERIKKEYPNDRVGLLEKSHIGFAAIDLEEAIEFVNSVKK